MKNFTSVFPAEQNDGRNVKINFAHKQKTGSVFYRLVPVLFFFIAVLASFNTSAQLLQWNTFGNAGTETTEPSVFNNANISAATLNFTGSTVTPAGNGNRFGGSNWAVGAFSAVKYIQFTVTPNSGFTFTPTSFVFIWDLSGTGPSSVSLRSSIDNYATDIATLTGLSATQTTFRTINISGLTNIATATTFRLYGYNAGGVAGTGGFDCSGSVNNVVLNGTAAATAAPPVISSTLTATATVGTAFSYTITATNSPTTFSSTTTFPVNGFNRSGAVISGIPITSTAPGTQSINIGAGNGAGSDSKTLLITVNKGSQVITGLPTTNTKTFGNAPYAITGVTGGGSGNSVTYVSSNTAVATISGSIVTITGAGTTTITASQAGNANWNAASDKPQALTVNKATQTISFGPLNDINDTDPDFALTATASSGLPVSYVSSNIAVATIVNDNMLHPVAAGSTIITASQAGDANYAPAINVAQTQNVLSTALLDQQIIWNPIGNKIYGDADFQLTAAGGESGNPVNYISSNGAVATILGDVVTITGPGITTITASQAGNEFYNPAQDITQDLLVTPKNLSVANASANNKVYDGNTTATISGATLAGIVGSDNVSISSFAGTFADANAATNIQVTSALTLSGTDAFKYMLVQPSGLAAEITKAAQTIAFGALTDKSVGDADFNLTASASSGLSVSYTNSNPAVATVTGTLVHIVALGSTSITASQAGNQNYNTASSIQRVQNVVPPAPAALLTFDFTPLTGGSNNFGPSPLTATTVNTNVAVVGLTRGSATITGTGAGKAWGGNNFTATDQSTAIAGNQFETFSITANPGFLVSLSNIPVYNIRRSGTGPTTGIWQYKVGSGSFVNIGSPVTWGAVTTNLGNDQAAIDLSGITALQNVGSTKTITFRVVLWGAGSTAGTWYLNEPGTSTRILKLNGFVNAAPSLPPVVNGDNLNGAMSILFPAYTVTATNGPINSYAISGGILPPGLSLNTANGQITGTPTAAGNYSVDFTAANDAGTSVSPGTINFTIAKANQVIVGLAATDTKIYGTLPYNITAVTGGASGNPVTYTSSNPLVATISGNTVTVTGAGVTTITASQGGNADYNPAPDVTQTLNVSLATQIITVGTLSDKNDTDPDFALAATASSGLAVSYASSNPAVVTIVNNNMVHIVAAGTTTITASQAGNTNYMAAADVSQVQNILNTTLQEQVILFNPLPNKIYGGADFQLTATGGGSGNPVTYVSSNTAVATITGDMVTIVGPGITTITASQAGNSLYNAAANVNQNQVIDVKTLMVSSASADNKIYDGTTAATISGALLTGIVGSDNVIINSFAGTFADANVANGIAVTAALSVSGPDAARYSLQQPAGLSANISKADQVITFAALPDKAFGDADFNLTASATSGLPVNYTSSNTSVLAVTNGIVHIVSTGSSAITASQAGNQNYNPAASVQQMQNILQPQPVALVIFDLTPLTGGTNNFGASPLTATATDGNVLSVGLTRGAGIGTTGNGAGKAWGGNNFTAADQPGAITANQFAAFSITAKPGYAVSLSNIPVYNIRRSGTGPTTGIWQYQVGSGAFNDIGTPITWGAVTTAAGNDQAAIDLSGIAALQNISSVNTITLRIVLWGATGTGGTWYLNESGVGTRMLKVNGNALPAVPATGFTGLPPVICISAAPVTLTGIPANGTFSGPGISGNVFDPAVAGAGTHSITYSLSGFSSSTQQVTVNTLPVLDFTGLGAAYCTTDADITLTGNQAGGNFTISAGAPAGSLVDNGNGTATFKPSVAAAAGPYTITYVYSNGTCNNTISHATTVTTCSSFTTLNLKVYLEGFYRGSGAMTANLFDLGISADPTEVDTIVVNLWGAGNLSNELPDHSVKGMLHVDGTVSLQFPASATGNTYYIAVKHRNSIETWSKLPVSFGSVVSYDFSTSQAQAYDDGINPPMKNMTGGVFAMYSGDTNQDGTIDATDIVEIDNNNSIFAFGYDATDITGDGATDSGDLVTVDNNLQLFLFYARPY